MQIRCTTCTKTIAIAPDSGALPSSCPHCAQRPLPARLGPYVLDRLVATGGMGEVYLARHAELFTEVAIKLLPAVAREAVDSVRDRFAREARLTAKVQHPGVVRVVDSAVDDDRPYLVLEFVRGQTLRALLQSPSPPAPTAAATIAAATADIVAAAHEHGVLHRDIKPDNIMLQPDGSVRVLDFGLARALAHEEAPLTRTGEVVGTPEYMAPEQLLDGPEATDERTDVHALGVLLYELLSGRSPFRSSNLFQTLKLVESLDPAPPPNRADKDAVSHQLQQVTARAMHKEPAERYASAKAFAAAVRVAEPAAVQSLAAAAPRSDLLPRPRRRVWAAAAAALALALLGAATITAYSMGRRHPAVDPTAEAPRGALLAAQNEAIARGKRRERRAKRLEELAQALRDGRWQHVLRGCEHSRSAQSAEVGGDDGGESNGAGQDGGDFALRLRALSRTAFALGHTALPRALSLPVWIGQCDANLRTRLFGGLLEPADAVDAQSDPSAHAALLGDRAALLQRIDAAQFPDSIAARIVRAAGIAKDAQTPELEALMLRLPTEEPEHWLLRAAVEHLRGNYADGTRAAETAWLTGAGERAVLFDAMFAYGDPGVRRPNGDEPERDPRARRRAAWRRLAAADRADCPASTLLMLALAARTPQPDVLFEPRQALLPATLPQQHHTSAASWFVREGAASDDSHARTRLLRIAAALGATPDFAAEPWRQVPESERAAIRKEAVDAR
ncbi:MAG: serine/threonine-protein kinase [Planctomycetota bacterium]